jgi:hypothetical protein
MCGIIGRGITKYAVTKYAVMYGVYIRLWLCIYGIIGREITKHTVIYGEYVYGSGRPYIYVLVGANTCCLTNGTIVQGDHSVVLQLAAILLCCS